MRHDRYSTILRHAARPFSMTHAAPKSQTAYSDRKHCGARRLRRWLHSAIGPVTACGGRASKPTQVRVNQPSRPKAMRVQRSEECRWELTWQKRSPKVTYPKTRVKRSSGIHSEQHVTRKPHWPRDERIEGHTTRTSYGSKVVRIEGHAGLSENGAMGPDCGR